MMCIMSKERIAFCALLQGTRGVVFAASPIALQSGCKREPNETIPTYDLKVNLQHLKGVYIILTWLS
jgi:hypothetical protein